MHDKICKKQLIGIMHYNWQNPHSLIRDVDIFTQHKETEAFIHTPEGATPEQLKRIPEALRAAGMVVTPDMEGDSYVLRIQHFKDDKALLGTLSDANLTTGEFNKEKNALDVHEKEKFSTKRLAGAIYTLGDLLVLAGGAKRSSMGELGTGIIWTSGGLALAAFGEKNPHKQMDYLYSDLDKFLKHEGIDADDPSSSIAELKAKSGIAPKLERFLRERPVEFNNTIMGLGGLSMIKGGWEQISPAHGGRNYFKMAAGAGVASGQWLGILVDPKKPHVQAQIAANDTGSSHPSAQGQRLSSSFAMNQSDESKEQNDTRGLGQKALDYYNEQPLRYTRDLNLLNNALMFGSAAKELPEVNKFLKDGHNKEKSILDKKIDVATKASSGHNQELEALYQEKGALKNRHKTAQNYRQGAFYNIGSTGLYVLANIVYGMSSRDINADLDKQGGVDEISNAIAHVAAKMPEAQQNFFVKNVAGFLASKDGVKLPAAELTERIEKKLDIMAQNPWEQVMGNQMAIASNDAGTPQQNQRLAHATHTPPHSVIDAARTAELQAQVADAHRAAQV